MLSCTDPVYTVYLLYHIILYAMCIYCTKLCILHSSQEACEVCSLILSPHFHSHFHRNESWNGNEYVASEVCWLFITLLFMDGLKMCSPVVPDSATHAVIITATPTTPQTSQTPTPSLPLTPTPSLTPPPPPPPPQECGVPGSPANGQVDYRSQAVGSVASYECDEGFTLVGESTRVCENNTQWSGSVPTCTGGLTCMYER